MRAHGPDRLAAPQRLYPIFLAFYSGFRVLPTASSKLSASFFFSYFLIQLSYIWLALVGKPLFLNSLSVGCKIKMGYRGVCPRTNKLEKKGKNTKLKIKSLAPN